MKYFTHYWQNDTWEYNRQVSQTDDQLEHISGNLFTKRGVRIGDLVYVVTVIKGKLLLCGKLEVGKFSTVNEVAEELGKNENELWQADEHIKASRATNQNWDLQIPMEVTKQLEFISNNEIKKLTFISSKKLDRQTLRGVRQLTPSSASLLDKYLEKLLPINSINSETNATEKVSLWEDVLNDSDESDSFESFLEGNKKLKFVTYYERLPENRKEAIRIHGYTCFACGFNFEQKYGELGKGFIHIHHIKPVSQYEKPQKINPETDLIPLCPNCHAMIHKNRNKTLSLNELKQIIRN